MKKTEEKAQILEAVYISIFTNRVKFLFDKEKISLIVKKYKQIRESNKKIILKIIESLLTINFNKNNILSPVVKMRKGGMLTFILG